MSINVNLKSQRFDDDLKGKRDSRVYVVTSDTAIGAEDAIGASEIPRKGTILNTFPPYVIVVGRSARPLGDPPTGKAWEVEVTGSTITVDPQRYAEDTDPTNIPAVIGRHTEYSREEAWVDLDGKPVLNSAGDCPDPRPEGPRGTRVITVRKTVHNYVDRDWRGLINCVNTDGFLGELIYCVLLTELGPAERWVGGELYTDLTATFKVREPSAEDIEEAGTGDPKPWLTQIIDRGFTTVVDGKSQVIVDHAGMPLNRASYLNGAGALLPPGEKPVPLPFRFVGEESFAELAELLGVAGVTA